jgi:hypothetical protein
MAGSPSNCAIVTQPGAAVVVDCTRQVVLRRLGDGYRPATPAGSMCDGETSYTLDLTDATLAWSVCNYGNFSAPYTLDTGTRTLTADELKAARAALEQVTVWVTVMGAVADIPTSTIDVTLPSQTQHYEDSLYAYRATPGTIYVDKLPEAFRAVAGLGHK